jgi:hypothetical protein
MLHVLSALSTPLTSGHTGRYLAAGAKGFLRGFGRFSWRLVGTGHASQTDRQKQDDGPPALLRLEMALARP